MSTDLLAVDRSIQRVAILLAKGITSTSSEEESRQLTIEGPSRYSPPQSGPDLIYQLPDSSAYVAREFRRPIKAHSYSTVTVGAIHWDVIEPASRQKIGIEAAIFHFAKRVSGVSEVVAVTYSTDGEVHLIWTFISRRTKDIRRHVYEEELQLMRKFRELTFDFNVVSLDRVEAQGFLADDLQGQIVFYREHQS